MKPYQRYDKRFCITEDTPKPEYTKQFEGEMTQGSGYLHLRGSLEEGLRAAPQDEDYMRLPANVTIEKPRHPRSKCGVYIPGTSGRHPLLNEEVVNLPFFASVTLMADGESFDIDSSDLLSHMRYLDMRDGVLYRDFVWKTKSGATVIASYARFLSRANPNVYYWQGEFSSDQPMTLTIVSKIDASVRTNGYNHFTSVKNTAGKCIVETDNGDTVTMTEALMGADFTPDGECQVTKLMLSPNAAVTVTKLVVASTSRDAENPNIRYTDIESYLKENTFSFAAEYEKNKQIWDKHWDESGIIIEGDDEAQYAVNFSVYHMLRAVVDDDSRVAICAKGYAGEAYFGHFFWDTEIYLIPFFLYTQPRLAKTLAEFRIKTLPGAMQNAKNYGYPGARYPWESSVSGGEQCPNWQYCDHEVHITADVVFGLWHTYCNTGDNAFLRASLPVLLETSRYWMARSSTDKDGRVHINGVMGPDEYICFCDDNAYTNTMVRFALETTVRAFALLKKDNESILTENKTTAEELERFRAMAEAIVIPKDEKRGILMQCKNFDEFEEVNFDTVWKNRAGMFGNHISQEHNYRVKALKQADVLMLPYLFGDAMSPEELKRTYDYYFPFTTHDSSLSYVIHAILCARMQNRDEAYRLFHKALDIDTATEHKGAAEGIHIANCGGIWQGIVFGFAGMKRAYEADEPTFSPCLPAQWKKLSFNINFKGTRYAVTVSDDRANLTKLS